jgi:protein-L-isoaspartate(D-aspartate) O-methyltransferase
MPDFAARRRQMVDTQVRPSDVTKFPIIDAMLRTPREAFVPDALREAAYAGEHLPLGPAGRVLLDPRSLAKLLDALDLQPAEMVLVVGAGLGYGTAVVARLAETVVAVEEDAGLAAEAQRRLSAAGADNAAVIEAPLAAGAPRHAPYDAILVEGAVEVIPQALAAQLREGGRIGAIFAEGPVGAARIGLRRSGALVWREAFNAAAPVLPGFARQREFTL